eukprot:jgi/Chrzof1/5625/Cz16g09120.t1
MDPTPSFDFDQEPAFDLDFDVEKLLTSLPTTDDELEEWLNTEVAVHAGSQGSRSQPSEQQHPDVHLLSTGTGQAVATTSDIHAAYQLQDPLNSSPYPSGGWLHSAPPEPSVQSHVGPEQRPAATSPPSNQRLGPSAAAAKQKHSAGSKSGKPTVNRYRERQKQSIISMQKEVEQKMSELQMLSAANAFLKLRTSILETAVQTSEHTVKMYAEHGPPSYDVVAAAAERVDMSLQHLGEHGSSSRASTAPYPLQTSENNDHLSGSCDDLQNDSIQIHMIKTMSSAEVAAQWKAFLQEVCGAVLTLHEEENDLKAQGAPMPSPELVKAAFEAPDEGPGIKDTLSVNIEQARRAAVWYCSVIRKKLHTVTRKYSQLVKYVALLNPGALYQLHGVNLDNNMAEPPPDSLWRDVLRELQLSSVQLQDLCAGGELYHNAWSKVIADRNNLQLQLSQVDHGQDECKRELLGDDGIMSQFELMQQLNANLKREHTLRILLNCFFYGRVLTSQQFAKAAMYSYPYFPDVHAMMVIIMQDVQGMQGTHT